MWWKDKTDEEIKALPPREFRKWQRAAREHFISMLVKALQLGPKSWERTTFGIRLIADTSEIEKRIAELEGQGKDIPLTAGMEFKTSGGFPGLTLLAPGRFEFSFREKLCLWRYIKFIEQRLD